MEPLQAKLRNDTVFIHHVDPDKQYALVAYTDLEVDDKKLDAYLLVQVEKRR